MDTGTGIEALYRGHREMCRGHREGTEDTGTVIGEGIRTGIEVPRRCVEDTGPGVKNPGQA
jgi:hypothetical protein